MPKGGTTGADGRLSDAVRLRRLRDTGLLDAAAHPSLDRLARTAAHQLRCERAQVALIAADRRVVAGAAGPPLAHSFCRLVVDLDAPLLIVDAYADERIPAAHPALADGVIAYAGFPIRSPDGYPLGAFFVTDGRPRDWEPRELLLIEDLAAAAASEIALRVRVRAEAAAAARLRGVLANCQDAYIAIDVYGAITAWNAAAERLFGYPAADAVGRQVADLIIPERYHAAHAAGLARLHSGGVSTLAGQRVELTGRNRAGAEFGVEMTLQADADADGPVFHAFLHDITYRQEARTQLEHDRTFLQALLDSLDAGVAACDADGRLTLFNQAMRDIHGTEARPLVAGSWPQAFDLYRADGRTPLPVEEIPLARAYGGQHVDGQEMVVAPAGEAARVFVANARPIDSADGRRLGAVVAMHDVTASRRAEAMREVRLTVARVLADASSGREAADRTVAALGRALGWAVGEFWQTDDDTGTITRVGSWLDADRDPAEVAARRPLTVRRGEGMAGHIWADGADLWVTDVTTDPRVLRGEDARAAGLHTAIGVPVRSADRILGVLLFFSATTQEPDPEVGELLDGVCAHLGRNLERRRAEDLALALSAARRDFDRVIERVEDYVWTIEVRPDKTVGAVYTSPDGTGVFGGRFPTDGDMAAEMMGRVHPEDEASYQQFFAKVAGGEPAESEVRLLGTDGVTRWIWTRALPRVENGRLLVDGVSTNVTERRLLAEQRERLLVDQRQQNDQLRHLDRLKDELVAVVSHELRNPLGAIRSYSETLLEDEALTAEQRHLAEVIDRRSAHMQTLVDDLLDLARLEAGNLPIDPKPASAVRLLRDAVQALRPAADAKKLTVVIDAPRHVPVQADPVRLRQVLDNLLSNAVKYTPAGGRVTITVRHRPDVDETELVIADTGIGVPEDQCRHLFERFFRADNAVRQGIKGTGLGLAITKAIVEAHGGRITAAPGETGGMTFTVILPAG